MPGKRWFAIGAIATCIASAHGPAFAQRQDPDVDVTDARSIGKFLEIDLQSSRIERWRPFLVALSQNDAIARNVDDAAIRDARLSLHDARGYFFTTVIAIVAEGLRRVDDLDLTAARPLIAKFMAGPDRSCDAASSTAPPDRGRIMLGDTADAIPEVLTRAVLAVNARRPPIPFEIADYQAASARSRERLSDGEQFALLAYVQRPDGAPSCAMRATMSRVLYDGPIEDAPVMMRATLKQYVESVARPRVYVPGDEIAYPTAGRTGLVTGRQVVRFTIDPSGRLKSADIAVSTFAPTTISRPDGTVVSSSELFDDEVLTYLHSAASRYPPKERDGAPHDTTYEIPFVWQLE